MVFPIILPRKLRKFFPMIICSYIQLLFKKQAVGEGEWYASGMATRVLSQD